jgi:DNA-binding LytR/AlgR family response regulator
MMYMDYQSNFDLSQYKSEIVKKSFLVFRDNKYSTIPTKQIAYFFVKHEIVVLVTFGKEEYFVHYSLEHLQRLLSGQLFYRLNRQYLVSFNAIKEVEHYFARKLLVTLSLANMDKLVVSKEKASSFLQWLGNR